MISLRVSAAAQDDLRTIRRYSEHAFGVTVAKTYMAGLRSAFTILRDHPGAGAEVDSAYPGVRSWTYRSHRLLYRVRPGHIEIVRILHGSRDLQVALSR